MVHVFKNYLIERKKSVFVYSFREASKQILFGVSTLLNDKRPQKIQFFIKTCEEIRQSIIKELKKREISNDIRIDVEQLRIEDLHDCNHFGKILNNIFIELHQQTKLNRFAFPIYFNNVPVTSLEVILLFVLLSVGIILFL